MLWPSCTKLIQGLHSIDLWLYFLRTNKLILDSLIVKIHHLEAKLSEAQLRVDDAKHSADAEKAEMKEKNNRLEAELNQTITMARKLQERNELLETKSESLTKYVWSTLNRSCTVYTFMSMLFFQNHQWNSRHSSKAIRRPWDSCV